MRESCASRSWIFGPLSRLDARCDGLDEPIDLDAESPSRSHAREVDVEPRLNRELALPYSTDQRRAAVPGPPDGERRQLPAICRARQRLDRHHDAARRG